MLRSSTKMIDMDNPDQHNGSQLARCTNCDSVLPSGAAQCLMCGEPIDRHEEIEQDVEQKDESSVEEGGIRPISEPPKTGVMEIAEAAALQSQVVESEMRERLSPITFWLTALFVVGVISLGFLVLLFPADAAIEFIPTATPIPVVLILTENPGPAPTEPSASPDTPTPTVSPAPTETIQPPRPHTVASGETLFGISLRYGVSMESIAEESSVPVDTALQISQELLIPWPTATPPLVPVEVEVGSELLVADPTDCQIYEIQRGDTLFGIAASFNVPSSAMLAVNRLSELSILQPGDTICIPQIIYGSQLPATPGPSPTPGPTSPPPGPELLYPTANSNIPSALGAVALQWVAVKDLTDDEWYMIELTDLTDVDSHPRRAFTRQTSFQLPEEWDPSDSIPHDIRWRISIVLVTGQREDGSFIFTFGGQSSEDAFFLWGGDSG